MDTEQKKETGALRREDIVLYVEIYFSNKYQTNDNTVLGSKSLSINSLFIKIS